MKSCLSIIALCITFYQTSQSQDIQWCSLQSEQNFGRAKIGADYGLVTGLTYGRRISQKHPAFLSAELSIPFGKDVVDDFKAQVSLQREMWQPGRFSVSLKPGFILRRYASEVAILLNTSVDLTASLGYMRQKWAFAAEGHYDRTLATRITHRYLKEIYPGIYDGWIGSTGGNVKLGAQVAYNFGRNRVSLRIGQVFAQNFRDQPTLPFYGELSVLRVW